MKEKRASELSKMQGKLGNYLNQINSLNKKINQLEELLKEQQMYNYQNGVLKKKFDLQQISNTKKFRQFEVMTEGGEMQVIKFTCSQNMCTMIDNFNIGDRIKVRYSIREGNVLLCDHVKKL